MRFTSESSADGVTEQSFTVDEIPGVLWTPDQVAGPRPLILLGHGGGQHKRAPGITARAVGFAADGGFAAAAIDAPSHGDRPPSAEFTRAAGELRAAMAAGRDLSGLVAMHDLLADQAVADWQRVIGALQDLDRVDAGAIGYWGVSMGTGLGVRLLAARSGRSRGQGHRARAVPAPVGRRAGAPGRGAGPVRRAGFSRENPARESGRAPAHTDLRNR